MMGTVDPELVRVAEPVTVQFVVSGLGLQEPLAVSVCVALEAVNTILPLPVAPQLSVKL